MDRGQVTQDRFASVLRPGVLIWRPIKKHNIKSVDETPGVCKDGITPSVSVRVRAYDTGQKLYEPQVNWYDAPGKIPSGCVTHVQGIDRLPDNWFALRVLYAEPGHLIAQCVETSEQLLTQYLQWREAIAAAPTDDRFVALCNAPVPGYRVMFTPQPDFTLSYRYLYSCSPVFSFAPLQKKN